MERTAEVEKLVKSLSFEVEAVPYDNLTQVKSSSNFTPVNVKIRVRKKEEAGIQKGVISLSRFQNSSEVPQNRVRLASSDQTIISFNVLMETEFDKKKSKKPRKHFLGKCFGSNQVEDDACPYMPANAETTDNRVIIKPSELPLSHVEDIHADQTIVRKPKKFFGICKPGGCLDPPFDENKNSYSPRAFHDATILKSEVEQNLFPPVNGIRLNKTQVERNDNTNSILNLYQKEITKPVLDKQGSISIITYPPTSSFSELDINDTWQENYVNTSRHSSTSKARKSYEMPVTYYSPPKRESNEKKEKLRISTEICPKDNISPADISERYHIGTENKTLQIRQDIEQHLQDANNKIYTNVSSDYENSEVNLLKSTNKKLNKESTDNVPVQMQKYPELATIDNFIPEYNNRNNETLVVKKSLDESILNNILSYNELEVGFLNKENASTVDSNISTAYSNITKENNIIINMNAKLDDNVEYNRLLDYAQDNRSVDETREYENNNDKKVIVNNFNDFPNLPEDININISLDYVRSETITKDSNFSNIRSKSSNQREIKNFNQYHIPNISDDFNCDQSSTECKTANKIDKEFCMNLNDESYKAETPSKKINVNNLNELSNLSENIITSVRDVRSETNQKTSNFSSIPSKTSNKLELTYINQFQMLDTSDDLNYDRSSAESKTANKFSEEFHIILNNEVNEAETSLKKYIVTNLNKLSNLPENVNISVNDNRSETKLSSVTNKSLHETEINNGNQYQVHDISDDLNCDRSSGKNKTTNQFDEKVHITLNDKCYKAETPLKKINVNNLNELCNISENINISINDDRLETKLSSKSFHETEIKNFNQYQMLDTSDDLDGDRSSEESKPTDKTGEEFCINSNNEGYNIEKPIKNINTDNFNELCNSPENINISVSDDRSETKLFSVTSKSFHETEVKNVNQYQILDISDVLNGARSSEESKTTNETGEEFCINSNNEGYNIEKPIKNINTDNFNELSNLFKDINTNFDDVRSETKTKDSSFSNITSKSPNETDITNVNKYQKHDISDYFKNDQPSIKSQAEEEFRINLKDRDYKIRSNGYSSFIVDLNKIQAKSTIQDDKDKSNYNKFMNENRDLNNIVNDTVNIISSNTKPINKTQGMNNYLVEDICRTGQCEVADKNFDFGYNVKDTDKAFDEKTKLYSSSDRSRGFVNNIERHNNELSKLSEILPRKKDWKKELYDNNNKVSEDSMDSRQNKELFYKLDNKLSSMANSPERHILDAASIFPTSVSAITTPKVSFNSDPIQLDLRFKSYTNSKSERIVKTMDSINTSQYEGDHILVIQTAIKPNDEEVRLPVDPNNDIVIKIMKKDFGNDIEMKKFTNEVPAIDEDGIKQFKNNFFCKEPSKEMLHETLTSICEQALIPLHNLIKSMKEDVDLLAEQRLSARDKILTAKMRPSRLVSNPKRCGCLSRKCKYLKY